MLRAQEDASRPCGCWGAGLALPGTTRLCIPGCLEPGERYLGWVGGEVAAVGRAGQAWHTMALTTLGQVCGHLQAGVNSLRRWIAG